MNKKVDRLDRPSKLLQNTNLDTVYFRSFSDIPNAKEVSKLVDAEGEFRSGTAGSFDSVRTIIPSIEARYKAVDALIMESGIKQVVEFAAGRTTRGINNPQWNYIHTDYDGGALEQIEHIAKSICRGKPTSMHFVRFNAITGEGLEEVLEPIKQGKVAVVHEGLGIYCTLEQKAKIALNARTILERHGGIYITPDIRTKQDPSFHKLYPQYAGRLKEQRAKLGLDFEASKFEDREEAMGFFRKLGFDAEIIQYRELVDHIESLGALFLDKNEKGRVEEVIRQFEIWRMELR